MTQEVNQNTIILLSMFLDKYRDMAKNSNAYIKYEIAKEVVSDLEKLKESMKR
jgi:hypothetical protein